MDISQEKVEIESARLLHTVYDYRVMFDVMPPDQASAPINMCVYLKVNGQLLSATWQYQWSAQLGVDREFHNAGHLKLITSPVIFTKR